MREKNLLNRVSVSPPLPFEPFGDCDPSKLCPARELPESEKAVVGGVQKNDLRVNTFTLRVGLQQNV